MTAGYFAAGMLGLRLAFVNASSTRSSGWTGNKRGRRQAAPAEPRPASLFD